MDEPAPGELCGDGKPSGVGSPNALVFAKTCDDGNTVSGDGCNATCTQVEPGWICETFGEACVPRCGDGMVVGNEVCDIGQSVQGIHCRNCDEILPGRCGDGVIDAPFESCDDGNAVSLDGCNQGCAGETGFDCGGQPSECAASGLASELALEDFDEADRTQFCDWLIGTFGGSGARSVCTVERIATYQITVSDRVTCEDRLFSQSRCGISGCTVGEVEADVASGGTNLCARWTLKMGCSGRYLYELIAGCDGTPSGDDSHCEPTCR